MNRNLIFSLMTALSVITLAACSTAAPISTATSDTNIVSQNTVAPAATDSPATSAPASTADVGTTVITMDPNLECSGGKTSASTTHELTEGPYFKANSPERASLLEADTTGTTLVLTGYVYDTNCQPVANALLDFWQADANGVYDNSGYVMRGHQFTAADGSYTLTTVVPGLYPGRTEHIHFKVQAPNGKVITSQLFFPGVAQNDSDGIFDASLVLPITETSAGWQAQFNFIVP